MISTKRRLKLIFTGYKGVPQWSQDEECEYHYEVTEDGKLKCEWAESTTDYTLTIDENLVKEIFVPNTAGKISSEAYQKLYDYANGLIANSILSMNGIIPCFVNSTYESYFAKNLEGGTTHLTTVQAVWEVVNVQPIESL